MLRQRSHCCATSCGVHPAPLLSPVLGGVATTDPDEKLRGVDTSPEVKALFVDLTRSPVGLRWHSLAFQE